MKGKMFHNSVRPHARNTKYVFGIHSSKPQIKSLHCEGTPFTVWPI